MNLTNSYISKCKRCGVTSHTILRQNKKGFCILICLSCGLAQKNWVKVHNLGVDLE